MTSYEKSTIELEDMSARIEKAALSVQRLQAIERKLPKFEKDLRSLRKRLEISMTLLPEKNEIPELLTKITKLGSESGVEFVSFQPGNEKVENFYAEVPVSIDLRGSYHDLATFLDHIRTLRRIVHVRNLSIGSMKSKGGIISLSAKSVLVTYRFLSPEEEKKAATGSKKRGRRRRR